MSSTLKSMFKKQISWSVGNTSITEEDSESSRKRNGSFKNDESLTLRKKDIRRRNRTSFGALEDIIKCPICKEILQSPRMLACQHTFCKKCLETLQETLEKNGELILRCRICKATMKNTTPDSLPPNISIENVLRAMNGTFIETKSDKSRSLVVNFAPLTAGEYKRKNLVKCTKCETACEAADCCRHCKQIFCKICQSSHVAQLKEQLSKIVDQLQATKNKLEHRVVEFKEKTNNLKEIITKEFAAKMATLNDEKMKKLELIDEFRIKREKSADEIRLRILDSQAELVKQKDSGFDCIDDDNEKIDTFLELHKKATEMMSSALIWQAKVADMVEDNNGDIARIRRRESKICNKPKIICGRKELKGPSGIDIDTYKGDIYVACPGSAQIVVFDRQFRIMRRIHNPQLMAPQSVIFVDKLQEVFVTDKWKHTIFVFDRKGELVRRIGEKGQGEVQFRCPEGLSILQSRNWLYVADTGNDRVQILGVDGSYKGAIGPPTSYSDLDNESQRVAKIFGVHNFNQPTDVAVSNNAIVVADCGHHKIKVFNHKAQLMFSIGSFGSFKGLLKSPEVVKLDENNNIVVGDSDNNRVQIFSPKGTFLRTFGSEGTSIGHFGWISGILCLPNNEIIVVDSKNNTIQLF